MLAANRYLARPGSFKPYHVTWDARRAHVGGARMSTRVEGGTDLILVTAYATLSAETAHLSLSVREGPAPGTWRYNLRVGIDSRAQYGRVAGMTSHMDVLRYAAEVCAAGYQPGTIERGLLEQFATGDNGLNRRPC